MYLWFHRRKCRFKLRLRPGVILVKRPKFLLETPLGTRRSHPRLRARIGDCATEPFSIRCRLWVQPGQQVRAVRHEPVHSQLADASHLLRLIDRPRNDMEARLPVALDYLSTQVCGLQRNKRAPANTYKERSGTYTRLLPLDGARRLAGNVQSHPVHPGDLVDDPVAHPL